MEKTDHNAHSVYLMYYHLIMVVKYRRKVINDPISERAKEIWEYIAPRYGIVLEEWNHDIDHVHVMFRAQPKTELSKFINAYKSASSRLLKKEHPEIREKLWKEAFWSQSKKDADSIKRPYPDNKQKQEKMARIRAKESRYTIKPASENLVAPATDDINIDLQNETKIVVEFEESKQLPDGAFLIPFSLQIGYVRCTETSV